MSPPSRPVLAVFDLCDTLYAENTTLGFVRFLLGRQGRGAARLALAAMQDRRLPLFYGLAVLHRGLGLDLWRPAAVRLLAGLTRAELEAAARAYAAQALPARANAETHARLMRHRAAGDRVAIVSNSLDLVVEAVAARLGVEWRASRLGFEAGRCTGRIAEDLTGRKAAVVAALAGEAAPVIHAYTDNLSDRDLVAAADRPTIVIPRGRTRARWGRIDAEFLEL